MANQEKKLQDEIINATNSRRDARLFRNNVGMCTGKTVGLRFGLRKGSSDLIGWQTIIVNGRKIAIFMAVECKSSKGKLSKDQKIFLDNVNNAGGIGIVANSIDDVLRLFGEKEQHGEVI